MDFFEDNTNDKELQHRFEAMLNKGNTVFFDEDELVFLIDTYIANDNLKMANIVYDYAQNFYKDSNAIKLQNIKLLLYNNNTEEAEKLFDSIIYTNEDHQNIDLLLEKSHIAILLNRPQSSINICSQIIAMEPYNIDAYEQLCFDYQAEEEYENLLKTFFKIITFEDYNDTLIFDLSFNFQVQNKLIPAKLFFEKITEQYPLSKNAWFCLGVSQSALNLTDESINSFEFAISLDENYIGAYFNLANAYHSKGIYKKAIQYYQKTIENDTSDALTYAYIGECYLNLKNYEGAFQAFQKSLDLNPKQGDALMGISYYFNHQGQEKTAIRYAEDALKAAPDNEEYIHSLYALYCNNNLNEKAENLLTHFYEQPLLTVFSYLDFADFLYKNNDKDTAHAILKKAQNKFPNHSYINYRLANYFAIEERFDEAIFYLQNALSDDIENLDFFLNYDPDIINEPLIYQIIKNYQK